MPVSLPPEHGQRGGEAVQEAEDVDADHGCPVGHVQLVQAAEPGDARVVDEHVQLAELLDRPPDECLDVGAHRDVGPHGDRRPPASAIDPARASMRSRRRAASTTEAPRRASMPAISRPMPLLAPVTMTVLPVTGSCGTQRSATEPASCGPLVNC
nr:short-chain dehydrogenase/reductase SDR [uncultured bacterium]